MRKSRQVLPVDRFPSAAKYLSRLPAGLASYPECQAKASLYRDAMEIYSLASIASELPPPLRSLIERPVPVSDWIPEVHWQSLMLVLRDVHFAEERKSVLPPGRTSVPPPSPTSAEDRYVQFTLERNRRILQSPLYRVLFLVVSPERLLSGVQHRWEAFHRGSPLEFVERSPKRIALRLSYRPQLFDPCVLRGVASAFQASVEAANGKNVSATVLGVKSENATFLVQWT